MFNTDIIRTVQAELLHTSEEALKDLAGEEQCFPGHLYYPVTALGAKEFILTKSLTAVLTKDSPYIGPRDAAINLLTQFLKRRLESAGSSRERTFANAVRENLHLDSPSASCFAASLYGEPFPASSDEPAPALYSFALQTDRLPIAAPDQPTEHCMVLERAIYDAAEQQKILAVFYDTCEQHYLAALRRFGADNEGDILPYCWGHFRHETLNFLYRFRSADRAHEREWILTLIDRQGFDTGSNHDVQYRLVDDLFTPYINVPIPLLASIPGHQPVDHVVLRENLPFERAKVAINQYMRHNRLHTVGIKPELA